MKKVLFVCTGNTCRSPMAEMILKDLLRKKGVKGAKVSSAGIYAVEGDIAVKASQTLLNNDCKLTAFKSRQITDKMLKENNLIVCMTKRHKDALEACPNVYTLDELTGCGDIEDPYGCGGEIYQACFEELQAALAILAEKLIKNNI